MSEITETLLLLKELKGFINAVEEEYPDDVIVRCELTAGDIRAIVKCHDALERTRGQWIHSVNKEECLDALKGWEK
jgi:hypothetical protein